MPCSRGADHALSAELVPYTERDLWLFCSSEPGAGTQGKSVFRSSDGGRHWRVVSASGFFGPGPGGLRNLPTYGYLNSAAVTARSGAWMALGRSTLLHTADGGRTWHPAIPLSVDDPGGDGVGPVQFVDRLHGWLFSFPNLLFRTTDGGLHWQEIRLG